MLHGLLFLILSAAPTPEPSNGKPSVGKAKAATPPEAETRQPEGMKAVVKGLYFETHIGGGYTVSQPDVEPDAFSPGAKGSEGLGAGSAVVMSLGYDIADAVALELVGGAAMIAGTRTDKVRDMAITFFGVAARLAFSIGDRTNFVIAPGGIYASADNGVEKAQVGTGLLVRAGLEYYVHVRHFSLGLEIQGLMPLRPARVFVALAPSLKYTF